MAHKKGVGSTDNGRDSNSKRLGVKLFGGEHAVAGNIILRQRGTKYHPGENVGIGRDHTIYALVEGKVAFNKGRKNRTYVNILPNGEVMTKASAPQKKAAAAPAPAPSSAAKAPATEAKAENLTKIEGIGPKVNELLQNAGINSFAQLAAASFDSLKEILAGGGSRYQMMNPTTWPQQAQLAADGNWDELKALQDKLDGGKPLEEQE